jgi:hypothetical protein
MIYITKILVPLFINFKQHILICNKLTSSPLRYAQYKENPLENVNIPSDYKSQILQKKMLSWN